MSMENMINNFMHCWRISQENGDYYQVKDIVARDSFHRVNDWEVVMSFINPPRRSQPLTVDEYEIVLRMNGGGYMFLQRADDWEDRLWECRRRRLKGEE
jgi:hypothetical protein